MKRGGPLKRNTPLGPGKKALQNQRKYGTPLRPRSKRKRQQDVSDEAWREEIVAIWGEWCVLQLPGCSGRAGEIAHLYAKQPHPEWRTAIWNGLPLCAECHRTGPLAAHRHGPTAAAMREMADELRAAHENRRPQPSLEELQAILTRHMREANRDAG